MPLQHDNNEQWKSRQSLRGLTELKEEKYGGIKGGSRKALGMSQDR